MSDPKAFDPRSKPAFIRLDPSPLPDCWAFHFCLIFLNPSLARLKYIWRLFLLEPIVLTLLIQMLIGSCFLLILSHFETKDLPFGRLIVFGFALFLRIICFLTIFYLILLLFFHFPNIFPKIGFAISPNIGAPIDAKSPSGRPLPLCLLFAYLYLPPKYQIPFLLIVFLFPGILKKQSFLLFIYLLINYSKKSSLV